MNRSASASRTTEALCPWGRWTSTTYRLTRSTRVAIADRCPRPTINHRPNGRDSTVVDLAWSFVNEAHVLDLVDLGDAASLLAALSATGAQHGMTVAEPAGEQGLINRLCACLHRWIVRVGAFQVSRDLLGRSTKIELGHHDLVQLSVAWRRSAFGRWRRSTAWLCA